VKENKIDPENFICVSRELNPKENWRGCLIDFIFSFLQGI
jgi:hypothetical protein